MEIKIKKSHLDAIIPKHAKYGDAGMDLCSVEDCSLNPLDKVLIKTGLHFEIPENYFGSIRDRSGLAVKYGIHILAGVVDSGYRGEIIVALVNLGKEKYEIKKGDRIAQIIIQPYAHCDVKEVEELSESERGYGGFGSTGLR